MVERKPRKKVPLTEDYIAALTQRYDANTLVTLLQEVEAQSSNPKFDWNELVKKSSTGISNAREYQMLWRHLAYNDSLDDNLEDSAELLDDNSDVECELEVVPPVSAEFSSEAAACVKVLIASHALTDSTPSSSIIEAPLTIEVPVLHPSRTPNRSSQPSNLIQGTTTFPVTIRRQARPSVSSTEGTETKGLGGGSTTSKRKRKAWSGEEDIQLRAAVQKFGEGNWANMAKGDNFPIKRSADQLDQRWSFLRKKDGIGGTNSVAVLPSIPYTTAEQLATRHSLSLALDMPCKKLTPEKTNPDAGKNQVKHDSIEVPRVQSRVLPQQQPVARANSTPNPAVKATAIAVGARIVSPSDTSQLKVARSRNVVLTRNSSLSKSATLTGLPSESKVQSGTSSCHGPVLCLPSQSAIPITCTGFQVSSVDNKATSKPGINRTK